MNAHSLSPAWLVVAVAVSACGAKVDAYEPTLGGIVDEGNGLDPNAPPRDVSFVDGTRAARADDAACAQKPVNYMVTQRIIIANGYRKRTVQTRYVDEACKETPGPTVGPGESGDAYLLSKGILRIYDAADGALLSAWSVEINSIGTDRIVLRSTSPDILFIEGPCPSPRLAEPPTLAPR